MDTILPIEISNIIYLERATLHLKDICQDYEIDFDKFCQYLIENNGRLTGSCALACIDPECSFNDMDLFVFVEKDKDIRYYYKEFLKVFTIDQSEVNVGKTPLANPDLELEPDNQPKYLYTFNYHDKKIDMSLIHDNLVTELNEHYFFDISKIYFNGIKWNYPFNNIQYFLDNKEINILNPFDTYFDKIYSPWFDPTIDDTIGPMINTFILQRKSIKDNKMQQIYNYLQPYYTKEIYREKELSYSGEDDNKNSLKVILHMIAFDRHLNQEGLLSAIIKWKDAIHEYNLLKDFETVETDPEDFYWTDIQFYEIDKVTESKDYNGSKQINQLFRYYKGFYKILQYIGKGYIITNIDEYINLLQ